MGIKHKLFLMGKPIFKQGYRRLGIEACAQPHFVTLGTIPEEITCAIVLGCWVNQKVTAVMRERLDLALRLYACRPALKFILSGSPDNNKTRSDVDLMREYLVVRGIPEDQLIIDYAGWTTFKSFVSWRKQGWPERFILITSKFHLTRAVYIAVQLGLQPSGLVNEQAAPNLNDPFDDREVASAYKAWIQCHYFSRRQKRILQVRQFKKWLHNNIVHSFTHCLPYTLRRQLSIRYYMGYWPNLRQPQTYVEKLLAYMRSDAIEDYAPYADKLAVRKYVTEQVGAQYLTRVYRFYNHYAEIDFNKLPEKFYLKLNHGSHWNLPCAAKEKFLQAGQEHQTFMEQHLKEDFSCFFGERQYVKIKPQIYAEEFLEMPHKAGNMLRIFTFGGEPKYIQVSGKLKSGQNLAPRYFNNFYDCDWNLQPFVIGAPSDVPYVIPKPQNLAEMLAVAQKLAAPFPFVRVDLYNLVERIVFSELTFTPVADRAPVVPRAWDKKLGDLWPK